MPRRARQLLDRLDRQGLDSPSTAASTARLDREPRRSARQGARALDSGDDSRQGSSPAAPLTPSVRTALRLRSGVAFNVYRNRLLRVCPQPRNREAPSVGIIVPAIQPIIVYSLLDTMRAGVVAPQPPITPVELSGGKPVSPFIPPKSPRPPPKSPFTPPKEHQPSRRALRSSLLALGALDRPPLSGLPLSAVCAAPPP